MTSWYQPIATAGTLSGFVAGVTEPVIYGVNLPLKLPFYFGIAGGAIGGAIAGLACGPGSPVCVTLGVFIGGALAAFGVDFLW